MNQNVVGFLMLGAVVLGLAAILLYDALLARPAKLRRLMSATQDRAVVAVVGPAAAARVGYFFARIQGKDLDLLRSAFDVEGGQRVMYAPSVQTPAGLDPRDPARTLLLAAAKHALTGAPPTGPWDGEVSPLLRGAFETRLREYGCALVELRVAYVCDYDDVARQRQRWRVGSASLSGTTELVDCDALELWLDGQSGLGQWSVQSRRGPLRSDELLTDPHAELRVCGAGTGQRPEWTSVAELDDRVASAAQAAS